MRGGEGRRIAKWMQGRWEGGGKEAGPEKGRTDNREGRQEDKKTREGK
jgi:hypothetical protein